jgi:hypothetical protein
MDVPMALDNGSGLVRGWPSQVLRAFGFAGLGTFWGLAGALRVVMKTVDWAAAHA